jgi:hypothetical protein
MKQLITFSLALLFVIKMGVSQNTPTIGPVENDTIIVNSGINSVLLPEIRDGDGGVDQEIDFEVASSDPGIVVIDTVKYNTGETFAVLQVIEQGTLGTATIDVTIEDPDGTASRSFDIVVGTYNKPGIHYQIHDIVFWKEENPLGKEPLYDTIIDSTRAPVERIDWDNIGLTVSADCQGGFCDGHDFSTTMFKGYLVPPETGDYVFYQKHSDDYALWLSDDANHNNADVIIYNGDNDSVGTDIGNREWRSDSVSLKGGKTYAIYAAQWNIHHEEVDIQWEGPGIAKDYIMGKNLMHTFDTIAPAIPENLTFVSRGTHYLMVEWDPASDNNELAGYNVYANGYKVNSTPLEETQYKITGLTADTTHSIVVTAVDIMGNESEISNIITKRTYPVDNNPPAPPTELNVLTQTGMALEISWKGAADQETEVVAYNIYLDDELYNTSELVYDTSAIIKVLEPESGHEIKLEAIDAANNVSPKSEAFAVSTSAFDPDGAYLGVKRGILEVILENKSWNNGFGINPNYLSGDLYNAMKPVLHDLNPGTIRWGALTANPLNFSDHIETTTSIGDFMNLANELNAYTTFTCGVGPDTDWRNDTTTFLNFLEYINGPESSEFGAKRANEGYTESLLKDSKGLIFEFGNEVWGFEHHNADFNNYTEYKKWCRDMAGVMKRSPYWDEDKITLVYSARNPDPRDSYGLNEELLEGDTGEVDWLAVSGYLGPSMSWNTRLEYYNNTFAEIADDMRGLRIMMKDGLLETRELKKTFFYEGNMTTSSYNGRLGQAIVFTDYSLKAMENGSAMPTLFHLSGGQWRITDPTNNYAPLPLFNTAELFNEYCKGHVLKTKYSTPHKINDSEGNSVGLKPVGGYAYNDSTSFSIVLLSRDFEADHYVQLDLPDDFNFEGSTAKKYVVTGENFDTREATLDTSDIELSDSSIVKVPKYSMVLIHFKGDDQNLDKRPLADYNYPKTTNVEITCEENTHVIDEYEGQLHFSVSITPEDRWIKDFYWEIEDNDMGASFDQGVLTAPSSGVGMDTLYVKAISGDRQASDSYEVILDFSVSGEQSVSNSQLQVYPNPVGNVLNVNFRNNIGGTIKVLDMQGIVVKSFELTGSQKRINLEGLRSGMYFLRIRTDKGKLITVKFVKE